MSDQQSSYRQIFKATSIFGGVQIFNILIGIAKSKAAAIFLGPDGVGIYGLFTSSIDMIKSFTNLGIPMSSVREVAASTNIDELTIRKTITYSTKWYLATALLGLFVVMGLSPLLSEWTFGNGDYVWSFVALSVMIFFLTMTAGQLAILQGLRKISFIAKATLYGNLTGLIFLIPLYYYYGTNGIVPFLVISSAIAFFYSHYFRKKIEYDNVLISVKEGFVAGIPMVKLGLMLTISYTIAFLVGYIIRIYIKEQSSLIDVGYFTAVFSIAEGYMGIVFTAIVSDFYPRLSVVNKSNNIMQLLINQQVEMLLLIISPLIILLILTAPFVLWILYSAEFVKVAILLQWYMLGMYFKATSVPIAYAMLAKGDTRTYLFKDLVAQLIYISMAIFGFQYFGLVGIGIGYATSHCCNCIVINFINYFKYGIVLRKEFYKLFIPQFTIGVILFVILLCKLSVTFTYSTGIVLFIMSVIMSLCSLHKKLDIKGFFKKNKQ